MFDDGVGWGLVVVAVSFRERVVNDLIRLPFFLTLMWYAEPPTRSLGGGGSHWGEWDPGGEILPIMGGRISLWDDLSPNII